MEQIFIASTHDYLLFITNKGKAYWLKVHQIPEGSRVSRGQHIRSILILDEQEEVTTVISFKEFTDTSCIFMATARGIVKKVKTADFAHARTRGIVGVNLDEGDFLVSARLAKGDDDIILVTRRGRALRFHERQIRSTGRTSRGVCGIRLSKGDELSGVLSMGEKEAMLLVTEKGYGKRLLPENFAPHHRATKGQICYRIGEGTGGIVGVRSVSSRDDLVCITSQGNLLKIRTEDIPIQGKTAQGVKVVNINHPDSVVGVARAVRDD